MGSTLKNAVLAATAILALSANAHMVMKTPIPMGKSTLNNSPLDPSGSDFPCKLRAGAFDTEGAQNVMAIGESQTLSFTGSAVHGGGSCQVSLTTDLEPTKDSKWMVIKSIEGGCPASVAGNLPADPNGNGASTFQYSIPAGIAPGQYTLAWTWFNKVGNREMYMNCASVQVTGAKKRSNRMVKKQSSFPDMVVCNLAGINSCVTSEGSDYSFSNGGADVQKVGSGPFEMLAGGGGAGSPAPVPNSPLQPAATVTSADQQSSQTVSSDDGPQFASGPGPQQTASDESPSGANNPSSPLSQNPTKPQQTGSPGNFASNAASIPVVVPVTLSTIAGAQASANPTSGNGSVSSGGACTVGNWRCDESGSSFSRCVSGGSWSVSMPMAAGMQCKSGVSTDIEMFPKVSKRSHSHGGGHLRRMILDS